MEKTISADTLAALEQFSCNFEQLRNMITITNDLVWKALVDGGDDALNIDKIGTLTHALAELAQIRDREIEGIVKQIQCL